MIPKSGHRFSEKIMLRQKAYFFEGQGAPQGAQAPAKSCGETARPIEGEVTWSERSAAMPIRKTIRYVNRIVSLS
jgi:hypothetical protein